MDEQPREKRSVTELFQQVWSQALVTVSGAEEEVARLVGRLQGVAGWNPEEARKQVRELADRLSGQRRDIERRVDEAVKARLQPLRLPRREQVAQLSERLTAIARRVEGLSK